MSSAEQFTKEQLKKKLIAYGIDLPAKGAKKWEYVDLFNSQVSVNSRQFSSDEEVQVTSSSSKRSKRVLGRKNMYPIPESEGTEDIVSSSMLTNNKENQPQVQAYLRSDVENEQSVGRRMPTFWHSDSIHSEDYTTTINEKSKVLNSNESSVKDELSSLTNQQLSARLKELGIQHGPVGASTRSVYIKKIEKVLQTPVQKEVEEQQEYSDEEEAEMEIPTVPVTRSSSRRRTMQISDIQPQVSTRRSTSATNRRRTMAQISQEETLLSTQSASTLSATRRRPLRSTRLSQTTKPASPAKPDLPAESNVEHKVETDGKPEETVTSDRRWLPFWVQILVTLCLAVFFYLVFQYMESNPSPPFLSSDSGGEVQQQQQQQ